MIKNPPGPPGPLKNPLDFGPPGPLESGVFGPPGPGGQAPPPRDPRLGEPRSKELSRFRGVYPPKSGGRGRAADFGIGRRPYRRPECRAPRGPRGAPFIRGSKIFFWPLNWQDKAPRGPGPRGVGGRGKPPPEGGVPTPPGTPPNGGYPPANFEVANKKYLSR